MLLLLLAAVLCLLYVSDSVLVAYTYRAYYSNPSSTKLLFLAAIAKFIIASTCFFVDSWYEHPAQALQGKQKSQAASFKGFEKPTALHADRDVEQGAQVVCKIPRVGASDSLLLHILLHQLHTCWLMCRRLLVMQP